MYGRCKRYHDNSRWIINYTFYVYRKEVLPKSNLKMTKKGWVCYYFNIKMF